MKHLHNDQEVVTVDAHDSLRAVADLMSERSIGSVVVTGADGRALGIVTDRDLCLRAVAWDRDPDAVPVSEVMTHEVRGAASGGFLHDQVQPMRRLGVRRVPLLDEEQRVVGLIASDDWLRWLADRLTELSATADPALRHGPLRPPAELLDDLERHLEASRNADPMADRQQLDHEQLLEAITRLRSQMGA